MEVKRDYISLDNSNCLKGLFAFCVVACHIRAQLAFLNGSFVGQAFTILGYLSVAVFFFFSGYGLMTSVTNKGESYIKHFPIKRILPFYCNYLIAVAIYICVGFIFNKPFDLILLLKSVTFGGTYVAGGWYLQSILYIYIIFYLAYRFCKKSGLHFILLGVLLYTVFCAFVLKSVLHYESILAFVLGLYWAKYRNKIDGIFASTKSYIALLVSIFVSFCVFLLLGNTYFLVEYIRVPVKMLSAVAFVAFVIMLTMKVRINNYITCKFGIIYFEIYVSHGIFLELYRYKYFYVNNPIFYIIAVLISTIVFAILLHYLFSLINNLFKKDVRSNEFKSQA